MLPYDATRPQWVNSLAPGRFGSNSKRLLSNALYRIAAWALTVKAVGTKNALSIYAAPIPTNANHSWCETLGQVSLWFVPKVSVNNKQVSIGADKPQAITWNKN